MKDIDLFTQIAREHLGIETLQTRNADGLDFHDLAVWSLKAALLAAYEAGRESAQRNATNASKTKRSQA